MIRIGWKAGAEQYAPSELLEYAQQADAAGFDLLDVSDHFNPWDPAGQASFCWTWLGAVGATTQRIQIGPGVTCPILRYNPAVIAQAAATLETMFPGRTYLAVGTGEALNEFPVTAAWPPYRVRQSMLAEAIQLIRSLWSGEEVTLRGEYFDLRRARLHTLSETPPPLYVSSMVPGSSYFAGMHGDGIVTTGIKPESAPEIMQNFNDGMEASGRSATSAEKIIEISAAFSDDKDAVVEVMKQYWAGAAVPALFNKLIYRPEDSATNGEVVGNETLSSRMCISTDPQEHVRFIQTYADLGFSTIVLHSPGPDQAAFIDGFGHKVLPALRQAGLLAAA